MRRRDSAFTVVSETRRVTERDRHAVIAFGNGDRDKNGPSPVMKSPAMPMMRITL